MDSTSSSKDSSSTGMSSSYKKSNKIRDIVRLQQILKKWRNLAISNSPSDAGAGAGAAPAGGSTTSAGSNKGIRFLKRTLSNLSDHKEKENAAAGGMAVPKGCLAVSVGAEQKRFVIPTQYLSHQAFQALLREAEEEFGFEQAGVLRFPCPVAVFLNNLNAVDPDHNLINALNEDHHHQLGSNLGNTCRFSFGNLHDHNDVDDNQSCATYTYYSSNHQTPTTTPSHSHALQPPPPLCRYLLYRLI